MATKILLVEDEAAIREMVALVLLQQGYDVAEAADYRSAIRQVGQQIPHLVLLDWMLPGKSGLQFLQYLKQHEECSKVPVVMLTAKSEEKDCIACLNAGADDYLIKPFALAELLARVRALIRRYQGQSDNLVQQDDLSLNLSTQQVCLQDQPLEVTPKEFAILSRLIMRAGQTVNRELLQQDLYTWNDDLGSNTLEVHIHNLRRKLGKDRIRTVRGIGYRLEAQS